MLKAICTLLTFYAVDVLACQPCRPLGLVAAYKKADLVVIAKPLTENPIYNDRTNEIIGDNFVEIEITKNIKGQTALKSTKVKSYYGFCPYGLLLPDNKERLIFLRKVGSQFETLECKPAEVPVIEGKVAIRGKNITLDRISEHIESILQKINTENEELDLEDYELVN